MRKLPTSVVAISLALNVAGGAAFAYKRIHKQPLVSTDFAAIALRTFEGLPRGTQDTVLVGDSEMANAPIADLTSALKQRAIGFQTVDNVRTGLPTALMPPPARLAILAGTNDALKGRSVADFTADYGGLLTDVQRLAPHASVAVMTIPPSADPRVNARVRAFNQALRSVTARHHAQLVDLNALIDGPAGWREPAFTPDGIHMTGRAYAAAASAFREAVGQ